MVKRWAGHGDREKIAFNNGPGAGQKTVSHTFTICERHHIYIPLPDDFGLGHMKHNVAINNEK